MKGQAIRSNFPRIETSYTSISGMSSNIIRASRTFSIWLILVVVMTQTTIFQRRFPGN